MGSVLLVLVVVDIILGVWVSSWWFALLIILLPIAVITAAIASLLWAISGRILPSHLTKVDEKQLISFSDKVLGVVENLRIPYPILLLLIAKDVLRGKQSKFLTNIIEDSKQLKADLSALQEKIT